jgi:hypothetical protein
MMISFDASICEGMLLMKNLGISINASSKRERERDDDIVFLDSSHLGDCRLELHKASSNGDGVREQRSTFSIERDIHTQTERERERER